MTYVDLNPVRAKMAKTLETSGHTSIQYRINAAKVGKTPKRLMPFAGNLRQEIPHGLPFTLPDYLELVDITSRYIHPNKRGKVKHSLFTILERFNIEHEQ